MKHEFFSDLDWQKVYHKEYQPSFKPLVLSDKDTSNFDEEFTSQVPQDSIGRDSHLSQTMQRKFAGFTFVPETDLRADE